MTPEDSHGENCIKEELDSLFKQKCELVTTTEVTSQHYILHIAGTIESNCNIAAGTSGDICNIYNFSNSQLAKLSTLEKHLGGIIDVHFSPHNRNLLYTASALGYINLWDLRTEAEPVSHFADTTEDKIENTKPLKCFDISSSDRLLAAGTELVGGDAFMLFWDVRKPKLLGAYWDSHSDEITQVQFHPDNVDLLTSGSLDGLINIFDVSQSLEDDALLNSLNTEATTERLLWCQYEKKDCIACITYTSDIQLWRSDGVEPFVHFRSDDLGSIIKSQSNFHYNVVSAHSYDTDKLMVLAAPNMNKGESLGVFQVNKTNLNPLFGFNGNTENVRCSWYNQHHNIMVTGAESGKMSVWNVNLNNFK